MADTVEKINGYEISDAFARQKLVDKYEKPANGIPSTDMTQEVQIALEKAETAIQSLNGYATEQYVDDNGGKIDVIAINGADQQINNKKVDITVPTKTSELQNDSDFVTETYVDTKINEIPTPDVSGQINTHNLSSSAHADLFNSKANISNGTVISGNADFAEIGEWHDGNPNNENRIGCFVTLTKTIEGFVIDKATDASDVCGAVVTSPAFSGNADDKYDADGNLKKQYDYIALLGLVSVIDNGTCPVPGRCMPTSDGTAVPSTNNMGFNVISRIDATHIEIFVRPGADMLKRIKDDVNSLQVNKADASDIPTKTSDLTNDSGFLTQHQNINGKTDKVVNANAGDFAGLDNDGNLIDSGYDFTDFITTENSELDSTVPINADTLGNHPVSYFVPAIDYNPVTKTSGMTQAVGKDSDGKLWTEPSGDGGTCSWASLTDRPFDELDTNTLKIESGILKVNTTDMAEDDNTKPITSSGVYAIVGNIDALLSII